MAHTTVSQSLLGLARHLRRLNVSDPLTQCLAPRLIRTFATATEVPIAEIARQTQSETLQTQQTATTTTPKTSPTSQSSVLTTLYSWPNMEPTRFAWYNSQHLNVPLRRDILHRAVIYEADASRQGTASTKWRTAVHGSNRKIRPQKGTGQARQGDKKSPSRRGGGVAFGPHPRDFSTDLPRKVYDIAWRTALSLRYRKGELIVLDDYATVPADVNGPRYLERILLNNNWGRPNGRSLFVTDSLDLEFFQGMAQIGSHGAVKDLEDVDVKDLLECGRIIVDTESLNTLLAAHSSDLGYKWDLNMARTGDHTGIVQYGGESVAGNVL